MQSRNIFLDYFCCYGVLLLFILIFIIACKNVYALQIVHDSDGQIILKADSCEELKYHVEAIIKWTRARGEAPPLVLINCEQDQPTKSIDISNIIPSGVKKIYRTFPICEGPNCFNATLIDNKLNKNQRYTSTSEWRYYLETNCKRRDSTEAPQAGDVVAIRRKVGFNSYQDIHGFTFIDDTLSCSKNGLGADSACILQLFRDLIYSYSIINEKNCINPETVPPPNCEVFLNYYECSEKKLNQSELIIEEFDSKLSHCAMSGNFENYLQVREEYERINSILIASQLSSYRFQIDKIEKLNEVPMIIAARKGDLKSIQDLLKSGTSINESGPNGGTPLFEASLRGHLEVVRYLVEKGADIEKTDRDGTTPLHAASDYGFLEVAKYLLDHGAELNKANQTGWTALNIAANRDQLDVVKYLVEKGADKNKGNDYGFTPLSSAAIRGHLNVVRYLVEKGANINQANVDGWTPLNSAADKGHLKVVEYLVTHGADIEKPNRLGFTPLAQAVFQGRLEVVAFLVSHGANPLAEGKDHRSILDLAKNSTAKKNKAEILKIIEQQFTRGNARTAIQ